jgi:hypothetical protein
MHWWIALGLVFGLGLSAWAQDHEDRDMILVEPCARVSGMPLGPGDLSVCEALVVHAGDPGGTTQTFTSLGCGTQHLVHLDNAVGYTHVTVNCTDTIEQTSADVQKGRTFLGDPPVAPGLLD